MSHPPLVFPTTTTLFILTAGVLKAIALVKEKDANVGPSLTILMTTPADASVTPDVKICPPITVSRLLRTGFI